MQIFTKKEKKNKSIPPSNVSNQLNEKQETSTNDVKCPHCYKLCKGTRGVIIHISMGHPEIYINSVANSYQKENEEENEKKDNSSKESENIALKKVKEEISLIDNDLLKMLINKPTLPEFSKTVEDFAKILEESKIKLPGPKHPATKYYEARKRKFTFKNREHNFSQSTNPQRSSKNERKRRKEKYDYELVQHLFYYSRKKAVDKLLKSSNNMEPCKISIPDLQKSFKDRWGKSNDAVLENYGPEISNEEQAELDFQYNEHVTKEEVENSIKGISLDTSSGLDGVSIKSIKTIKCYETIALIANVMQQWNLVPELFRKARTILIYKNGDQNDVGNWRPISICSILRRIIERINDKRLNNYITLNDNQVGFMQAPGTFIHSFMNACLEKSKKEKIDC